MGLAAMMPPDLDGYMVDGSRRDLRARHRSIAGCGQPAAWRCTSEPVTQCPARYPVTANTPVFGLRHLTLTAGPAREPAQAQATWSERFDRPIQKPSMTWRAGLLGVGGGTEGDEQRRVVLDGRVRVGHARRRGLVATRARRRRRGPAPRRPRRRSRVDQPGAAASMRNSVRNGSPWVRKPEPMISTPSSRSGRSRSPSAEQPDRVVGRQRHLQHRDVGRRGT